MLRTAGSWGADVVVGEGQAFGTRALASAGRTSGCSPARSSRSGACPGRLVGETVDAEGRRAYVTTLRAREQDIRREKATSNVCTNQTLMAVTAADPARLARHARAARGGDALRPGRALLLRRADRPATGSSAATTAPFLREFALRVGRPRRRRARRDWPSEGFWPALSASSLAGIADAVARRTRESTIVVAVTERRTRAEIDAYARALAKAAR